MFSGASVAMTAGADFVVKGALCKVSYTSEGRQRKGYSCNIQLTLSCSVPKIEAR